MKTTIVFALFLLYFILWNMSDIGILLVAIGSCAGSFTCLPFLSVSCYAGIVASLLRGFTLGSEIATIDIHWKV